LASWYVSPKKAKKKYAAYQVIGQNWITTDSCTGTGMNDWLCSYQVGTTGATQTANVIYNYSVADSQALTGHYNFISECVEDPAAKAERLAKMEIEVARFRVAESKAEQLLMLVLSDKEQEQYRELGYIETAIDDKVYRIKKGRSGNVFELDKGVEKARYCIHPAMQVPDQDTMIAQLLMLRNNREEFLKTANRTVLHP
jgi:hypothetical protein